MQDADETGVQTKHHLHTKNDVHVGCVSHYHIHMSVEMVCDKFTATARMLWIYLPQIIYDYFRFFI